ncbi:hypothetical protein AGMMS50239_26750 [Bacteroidia bacterium]|nr:hypothetical protein AGMMS50239_26750 [Bacteroidia bacterium]
MTNILIDSCFWYSMFDKYDEHYNKVQHMQEYLEFGNIILPYPIIYETLNTRFVKRKEWLTTFNDLLKRESTVLVSDEPYKVKALSSVLSNTTRPLSLVDMTIRLMLDDIDLNINALITFNVEDFIDICSNKRIELISK